MTDEMNIAENGVEEQNLYEDALRSAEKEIEKDNDPPADQHTGLRQRHQRTATRFERRFRSKSARSDQSKMKQEKAKGVSTPPLRTTSSGRAGRRPQRCGIPGAFPLGEKCGSIRCRENAVGVRFGAVKYGERRKLAILL